METSFILKVLIGILLFVGVAGVIVLARSGRPLLSYFGGVKSIPGDSSAGSKSVTTFLQDNWTTITGFGGAFAFLLFWWVLDFKTASLIAVGVIASGYAFKKFLDSPPLSWGTALVFAVVILVLGGTPWGQRKVDYVVDYFHAEAQEVPGSGEDHARAPAVPEMKVVRVITYRASSIPVSGGGEWVELRPRTRVDWTDPHACVRWLTNRGKWLDLRPHQVVTTTAFRFTSCNGESFNLRLKWS